MRSADYLLQAFLLLLFIRILFKGLDKVYQIKMYISV